LPENARIANISFSPDAKKIAFTHTNTHGLALWIIDVATQQAKQLTDYDLNAVLDGPYRWFRDSERLLINKLSSDMPPLVDRSNELPTGPVVSSSAGQVSQLRTYQDLLKDPRDEQDFETLATSMLYWVDLSGNQTKYLDKAMYAQASFSPDGRYVLVSSLKRPFSYIVRYSSFPQETTVYDMQGNLVKKVNELPLVEAMPKGFSSVRTGKR